MMSVRGLMYYGKMYDKYIKFNSLNIYGSTLVKIPTPRYIVFYNGTKDEASVRHLKLSDAFIKEDRTGTYEWTATVYNLNKGKNDELRLRCVALDGYMTLVERVRENLRGAKDVAKAVDDAVVSCINDGILKEFLIAHRVEVIDMCLTEYDEKTFVNGIKEEGREESRREDRKEGRIEGQKEGRDSERRELIAKLLKRGKSPEEISDLCGYPMELIEEVRKNLLTAK